LVELLKGVCSADAGCLVFRRTKRKREREGLLYSDAEKYLVVVSDSGTGLLLTLSHTNILIV
jgi:hypothetical protein